jgi:ribosomal protein S18 acetylase RimI-like enzyme
MIFLPLDVFLRSVNSLSNIVVGSPAGNQLVCRFATPDEQLPALRWILARPQQPAQEAHAADFLRIARQRGIDLGQLWIATHENQLQWVLLPVPSPGRTLLLFSPSDYIDEQQADAARQLTQQVLPHYHAEGAQLAQVLFEPTDQRMIDLYASLGFSRLAELIYLQNSPRKGYGFPPLQTGVRLANYSEQTHDLFCTVIQQSYVQSLDCPGLSEMRNIEDVIAGHKAAGEFDPGNWFVLMEGKTPIGVILLSSLPANQTMELVYLGVVPSARGQGIGKFLFRHALALTSRSQFGRLNFAVDAGNRPALNLYYQHGMQRIGSKIAMLRDLRK